MTNAELVRQLRTASIQCDEMRLRDFGYLMKCASDEIESMLKEHKTLIYEAMYAHSKVPQWIPVTERLPEPETDVLAAFDDGYVCAMWQKWSLADEYEDGESPFDYYKDVGAGIHTVTHWMPIPEPPKEE